jgi:hypothetical protein
MDDISTIADFNMRKVLDLSESSAHALKQIGGDNKMNPYLKYTLIVLGTVAVLYLLNRMYNTWQQNETPVQKPEEQSVPPNMTAEDTATPNSSNLPGFKYDQTYSAAFEESPY